MAGGCAPHLAGRVPDVSSSLTSGPADVKTTQMLGPPAGEPSTAGPAAEPAPTTLPPPKRDRLAIPPEIPGADAKPLELPPPEKRTASAMREAYPKLPPIGEELQPIPGPNGNPLGLDELQAIALATNPLIRQAQLDVDAARGAAIQAGLYPNPNFGFQADQIGSNGTIGQPGFYFEQLIKTAGKLNLARAAAAMNLLNAQFALRRAQVDLAAAVRGNYFAVLVARATLGANRALLKVTEESYRLQIDQVRAGIASGYEPLQLYVLAVSAQGSLIQAQNRYVSAWRQLAAALGKPEMPPTELAGRADAPVPHYEYDAARERMLAVHTDLGTAHNSILRERYNVQLQKVTPIPDIQNHHYFQRDYTTPPKAYYQVGIQTGIAIPIFDRNQGNIMTAEATLGRAIADVPRIRNDLSRQLADAFERYNTNVKLAVLYRDRYLPNQVRVYKGVIQRYQLEPDVKVNYNDIVTAQQALATSLAAYLTALGAVWGAVTDIAQLVQTDDLYFLGKEECGTQLPPHEKFFDAEAWPEVKPAPGDKK
jgi:cobalt-zinc-cadmium efflux system outer membrane protein